MDTWNGVKVLITGINGFVGANIAEKLVEALRKGGLNF